MARVLLWEPSKINWGHCALLFDDSEYISFWPAIDLEKRDLNRNVKSISSTFEKDVWNLMNRDVPDLVIDVNPKVNIGKAKEFWNNNKYKPYNQESLDCSQMVWEVLKDGDCVDTQIETALNEWRKRVQKVVKESFNSIKEIRPLKK